MISGGSWAQPLMTARTSSGSYPARSRPFSRAVPELRSTNRNSTAATVDFPAPGGPATTQAGAGTVTLTAPLEFAHQQGTLISALPATVIEAAVYAACAQALDSGIEAVAVQSLSGERVSSEQASQDIVAEYKKLLDPFRRVM